MSGAPRDMVSRSEMTEIEEGRGQAAGRAAPHRATTRRVVPLVRGGERPIMQWDNGVRFEEMASGEQVMDPSYIRVPSGAGSEGSRGSRGRSRP